MVQKRETKAINKLCAREILSLSFVCGAYFFEFRGRNLVCFVITYNFNGKYAGKQGRHACALRFSRVHNRPYLCSRYWTGTSIQLRLRGGVFSNINSILISF